MAPNERLRRVAAASGLVAVVGGMALSGCGDDVRSDREPSEPARTINVELGLTANRADWRPAGGPNAGTLVLEGVSAQTTVMAVAPARRATTIPTRTLRSTWHRFFAGDGDATNVLVSANGRLVPLRAMLVDADRSGRRLEFAVGPLPHRGLGPDRL